MESRNALVKFREFRETLEIGNSELRFAGMQIKCND